MTWYFEWAVFLGLACCVFFLLFYALPVAYRWFKARSALELKPVIKVDAEEPAKRCPVCEKKMSTDSLSGIIVDRCTLHGIWFDNGELESVVKYIKSGGNASVFFDA